MPEALPEVGVQLVLRDEDGGEHRSEVYAVATDLLTLVRPVVLSTGVPLLIGAEITLAWAPDDSAVSKARGRIATMRYDGEIRLWDVQLLGPPWREQRRQWPRVPASGSVQVSELAGEITSSQTHTTTGELVDISEVAARCSIDGRAIWAWRRNARLEVRFELGDDSVELNATVMTNKVSAGDPDRREIVLRFDLPLGCGDTVQRYVRSQL